MPADSTAAPIVLVGSLHDEQLAAIHARLVAAGQMPFVLDASRFPAELALTLDIEYVSITVDGVALGRPAAVYLRSIYQDPVGFGVDADDQMTQDWRRTMMAFRERASLVSAVLQRWEAAGVPMYNPPTSLSAVNKPYQLALLQRAGLPVPATTWTNDAAAVKAFCGDRPAIYKPVAGGALTRVVEPKDLTDERLATLVGAPVCFQELLPGDDIRVFVIDGAVAVALRIESDAIDFRSNEKKIETIGLDPADAAVCVAATAAIGLRWTGMDLKGDRDGRLRILELNSSPMFLGFDALAGCDVCGAISRALLGHTDGGR